MADLLNLQDLANGHLDVKALGEAANGDENTIVTTRTGNTYPSAERAINIMFQNGGLPAKPFATKALLQSSALVDGQYAMVTDDTVNNGLYVKTAGAWVKSSYDPLTLAKADATTKADAAKSEAISDATIYTDAQLDLVSKVIDKSGNLFRSNELTASSYLNVSNGTISTIAGYSVSDYIPIEPNTLYYGSSTNRNNTKQAFYDANKVYISEAIVGHREQVAVASPLNAAFIRMHTKDTVKNDVAIFKSNYVRLPSPYLPQKYVDLNRKINLSVSADELGFTEKLGSYNLVNPDKMVLGAYFGASGEELLLATTNITDFIKVESNTVYSKTYITPWAEYDINKQFLKTSSGETLTTSNATQYIRAYFSTEFLSHSVASVVKGTMPTTSVAYSDGIYIKDLVTDKDWYGKTIHWIGTSIPAGSRYPEMVAGELRAKLINKALSGGRVRAFQQDGSWFPQSNFYQQYTLKKSDIDARYATKLGKTVKANDYMIEDVNGVVLTQAMLDYLTRHNYENTLLPYVAETDLFVFDYGINDRQGQTTYPFMPAKDAMYDRSQFAGAIGFLVQAILAIKPDARIVMLSHHSRHINAVDSDATGQYVLDAQKDIAHFWNMPFLDVTEVSGVNLLTLDILNSGLHPLANGVLSQRYTKYIVEALKSIAP